MSALASPDCVPTRAEPQATILIVEDHDDSRDAMGQIVTALGYRALLARTGVEALTLLRENRPDLVLCDVRMPGMDGFAFVKAVRSQPGINRVKLVAVTGLSDRADIARLLQAGFDGHLVKPIDYDLLITMVGRVLGVPEA